MVLDGYALNPGDLDWAPLRALAPTVIYDRTPAAEIVPRAREATLALTNKTPFTRDTLAQLPALRYLGVLATGYNVVDTAAAAARGITVTNVPAYSTASVAQLVFAFILEWTHQVGRHAASVRQGRWCASPDFAYWETPLIELEGRTLGLVGFGQIGQAVARLGQAFGLKILVATRQPRPLPAGMEGVALDDLFRRADIVSLHCPLTEATRGLVNASRLALMKPTALLVNTSRGPVVVEADLAAALHAGQIAGAALDVLSAEPPARDNPLLTAPNCWLTPHYGWATRAARERLLRIAVDNVRAFLAGHPQNVVS